ncbi:MAG: DNA topoisomerase IV subunit A [Bacilli bacterium]|jgi:topoisomerase-4 subunit A|nr:DNA topoisomerase IV subunit A [Erysipelotrichia bacterium]
MAKKVVKKVEKKVEIDKKPAFREKISNRPLEEVMGERYASYAKYVIQDRAIPDVRDGLKPVQRRIIYSMYESGNTSSKAMRKCAHTVGAVMGKYHPHGDTSIYDALTRMSQDWKVRVPLIDFQGNNGSIDGDVAAAYRYTESRLSEIAEELTRDLEKKTVDFNLTFDDSDFEPSVLPARFPNLLVNGSEGIAVALATEIPPHNLNEVIDAVIYRLTHVRTTIDDLMQFIKGPDFPTGGEIFVSDGLKNIYETGRGRIEVVAKTEIINEKDKKQLIFTEIPYKTVKISLVYELDKIRHSKAIDGLIEVRDESDRNGLRIVVDLKKDAKPDVILAYIFNKTQLKSSYSSNMVAIVNGRPKTLNLLQMIDAYIEHQVDVITRRSQFDLAKSQRRLHIVDGLIKAISIVDQIVATIRSSKDKANAKENLQKKYEFSEEQSEAIVMLQLYKLSNTDISTLVKEKASLEKSITTLEGILSDRKKLDRVLIRDLKEIAAKYGTPRRTQIVEKDINLTIDKRDLIAKEEVIITVTRDGYIKRSTIKSYRGSGLASMPGLKEDDILVYRGQAMTTDFMLVFTNLGNYLYIPIHEIIDTKWREEGKHISYLISLENKEKIICAFAVQKFRDDLYLMLVSKKGQIKRVALDQFVVVRYARPILAMKLLKDDELVDVVLTNGNNNVLVLTSSGGSLLINENEVSTASLRSGGVKVVSELKKDLIVKLLTFDLEEKAKIALLTHAGHVRIYDYLNTPISSRLSKATPIYPCFKNDLHRLIYAVKIKPSDKEINLQVQANNKQVTTITIDDFYITPRNRYARANVTLPRRSHLNIVFREDDILIDKKIVALKPPLKEEEIKVENLKEAKKKDYEQISIFEDDENK